MRFYMLASYFEFKEPVAEDLVLMVTVSGRVLITLIIVLTTNFVLGNLFSSKNCVNQGKAGKK